MAALTCLRARQKLEIFSIHSSETTTCKIAIVLSCLLLNCGMNNTRLSLRYSVCNKSINFYKNGRKEWQKVVDWYKFEIEMHISWRLQCICNLYNFKKLYSYIIPFVLLMFSSFFLFSLCHLFSGSDFIAFLSQFSIENVYTKSYIYINMFYKMKLSRRLLKSKCLQS